MGPEKAPLQELKAQLRKEYLERRSRLTSAEQQRLSHDICQNVYQGLPKLWTHPESGPGHFNHGKHWHLERPRVVALYAAMRNEVNLLELAQAIRGEQGTTVYPKCFRDRNMNFYEVTDETSLLPSRFGVPEPSVDDPVVPIESIDVMLIPGVAFTQSGFRLGYGGGFYDKFLAQPSVRAVTIGVAYSFQIAPSLPAEPFDYGVDYVVTDKEILRCT